MTSVPNSTRILVIGGGPGGSTAATLLARQGYDVALLERSFFPRYHIGESLLPSILQVLELLGARQKIEQFGFQTKHGAFFEWGAERWNLNFGELSGRCAYSYQVERSEFDHMLLKHAASQGVRVFEGVAVEEIEFDGERPARAVWIERNHQNGHPDDNDSTARGTISFDYLIDASGRYGVMATRHLKNRRFHKVFQNVAIWGYWKNARQVGRPGDICCGSVPHGWLWAIPLRNAVTSVGVVMHKDSFAARPSTAAARQETYLESIKQSPLIESIVAPATLSSTLHAEQDYSYAATKFCGPGYYIVGDAACFLDPLLSSGVHLATYSALLAAASVGSTLRGEVTADEAAAFYERSYRQAYLRFLVFLSAFYDVGRTKESYFWEAQQLTGEDVPTGDLKLAFLNLVTGIKDMADVQDNAHRLVLSTMARRIDENLSLRKDKTTLASLVGERDEQVNDNAKFFTSVEGLFAMNEAEAIAGLFVAAEPQLRLARAGARDGLSTAPSVPR